MKNTQFWPKNEEGAMFEPTETMRRYHFLEIFWYLVNGHVFNFPNLEKNSARSSSIMEKNAKNWKNLVFGKTFLDVIFVNNNVWLRFICHNKRLEILHRLIYHTIYNTWILKTFPYNNRWKLRTAISRHYRNLEGYGNWKFFVTLLDLYVKKISSNSEIVDQKLCEWNLNPYRDSLLNHRENGL